MDGTRVLLGSGALVVGALALTEVFALVPAALAAYAGAWWVLALERRASRSGDTGCPHGTTSSTTS